jgi:beta-galactosidase
MTNFSNVLYGGDYNPEQWSSAMGYDEETILNEDMQLMRLAGVNIATIGVFSWSMHQPDETTFTFDWLDRLMDRLYQNNIAACLGTGTAAIPAWLAHAYPDVLPVDDRGIHRRHGGRQNYCPTSPDFRRLARQLAQQLSERYRHHPALALWHVSNEYYGGATDRGIPCHCQRCTALFRDWLQARYKTLDELNQYWMTPFWSHTFTSWEQIDLPGENGEQSMQGHVLDYQRFLSQSYLECYLNEAQILRAITPNIPVTTNMLGVFKPIDFHQWASHIDIIAWDSYPEPEQHPSDIALVHDIMRGLKNGRPFLLMEQTPSQTQWQPYNPLKRPGMMRLQSYQAMAHGADGVMFFQWRRSRGAAEMLHGAIVGHAGGADTRVFREVAQLGQELSAVGSKVVGLNNVARVAVLFSWPNWWATEYQRGPSQDTNYLIDVSQIYHALWSQQINIDVISPDVDLSTYDIVVAPLWHLVTEQQGHAIEQFVEHGGIFVATYHSGVVDEYQRVWLGYPGPLRRTLGLWVEEFDPLTPNMTNTVEVEADSWLPIGSYPCTHWVDIIRTEDATPLATFGSDFYQGYPAITEHQLGAGAAYYIATRIGQELLQPFFQQLLLRKNIGATLAASHDVEVIYREQGGKKIIFALNHNTQMSTIHLNEPMVDLLTGQHHQEQLQLERYGVAMLVSE